MLAITGTFINEITVDIPSQNWGSKEWEREFDSMKASGIDTVIIVSAGRYDEAIFPSKTLGLTGEQDYAQLFLDQAHRTGMKLFFGTYQNSTNCDIWNNWEPDWETNQKLFVEILERYGDHPAFYGWYVSSETYLAVSGSLEVYHRYSDRMKELSPDKKILISPFFPSYPYRDLLPNDRHKRFMDDWFSIFEVSPALDIVAFQDGSCCIKRPGVSREYEMERYFKEVKDLTDNFNLTNWINIETLGRKYPIKFPPISWEIMKSRMDLASKYAEKLITFEFSHYMSPNACDQAAINLHQRYMEEFPNMKT